MVVLCQGDNGSQEGNGRWQHYPVFFEWGGWAASIIASQLLAVSLITIMLCSIYIFFLQVRLWWARRWTSHGDSMYTITFPWPISSFPSLLHTLGMSGGTSIPTTHLTFRGTAHSGFAVSCCSWGCLGRGAVCCGSMRCCCAFTLYVWATTFRVLCTYATEKISDAGCQVCVLLPYAPTSLIYKRMDKFAYQVDIV